MYELSPSASGWTETIIHFFFEDGSPSGLIRDAAGNFYGETGGGGPSRDGTIYEMRHGNAGWAYRTLHNFNGTDGDYPSGGLILDAKGSLYGTTIDGGASFDGTVFELQFANGAWTENTLYTFESTADGVNPECALVFDQNGNLYGTTSYGGDVSCADGFGCGEVFELSPAGENVWTKTTVYAFPGSPDGHAPNAGLTLDKAGDLFGTTSNGGTANAGALFELQRHSDGSLVETILYSFNDGSGGGYPSTPLTLEGSTLLGTAGSGGSDSEGVAFAFPGLAK